MIPPYSWHEYFIEESGSVLVVVVVLCGVVECACACGLLAERGARVRQHHAAHAAASHGVTLIEHTH